MTISFIFYVTDENNLKMVQILSTRSFSVDQVFAKVVFLYAKKSHQLVSVINDRYVTQTVYVSTVTMLYFIMGK